MSRKISLSFVYKRKKQRMNSVVIRPTNDEVTVRSNSPSLAIPECADYLSEDLDDARRSRNCKKTVCQQGRILDDDDLCLLNRSRNCSQLSTSGRMSSIIPFNCVYKRKRRRIDSIVFSPAKPTDEQHNNSVSQCQSEATKSAPSVSFESNKGDKMLINGVVNNCSSSISNMEHDSGECSSSGALISEKPQELSETDICISILRSRGLLENTNELCSTITRSDKYCSKSCKTCNRRDSTKNMLICDNCEDAFHNSCCRPRIKIIPVGEWHCIRCLNTISVDSSNANGCDPEIGSLGYTLRDTEPYMSNVRIGDKYQTDTPEWRGPDYEASDFHGHLLEPDPCSSIVVQEVNSSDFIGNWIQCRGVLDGIGDGSDGLICGKWRRAPIFEVQTDDWECFCSISWDPVHADCAAPQEMETEEVVKQLKYIDMLRPRLIEKRRKIRRR